MKNLISLNIKDLRKINKYTQKQLAELLGVAQTTIANYENGIRVPDAEMLQKISNVFEVSIDYLLGREEKELKSKDEIDKDKIHEVHIENKDNFYKEYLGYLLEGNSKSARELILMCYEQQIPMGFIYFGIFEKALKEVGSLWESGKIDVWQEHFISEVTLDVMREVKAREKRKKYKSHSVIGVTAGPEQHNIGLKMVLDMLEMEGWNTVYLGSNVPVGSLIKAIVTEKPSLVAISVTMEYHIESAKFMIQAIKQEFKDSAPKIIIGGGAFKNNPELWNTTGADKFSSNTDDMLELMEGS
ncbi:helix-turn-helix domain-containing protein [Clostridium sp. YIM B02505]|uniref:Helix-turn-helix domain-containing protein n=1 Tax=Clostridium yunnanense TaxID=2800325 RepID=A0ABS1ERP2_9CLOT|nr:helix-turn-helix domain-containing protein [Clostridium yunnanense]MBK1812071.1 helix-turn-helix domain-containing protein [Clostridium yunnanense]